MGSMVSTGHLVLLQLLLVASLFFNISLAGRKLTALYQPPTALMEYHNGPLLCGKFAINLIWYGQFTPTQRAIVSDFVTSLSSPTQSEMEPSVATWWQTTETYYQLANAAKCKGPASLSLGTQILDESYSLGKSLSEKQIVHLAKSKGYQRNAVNVVLTASDVTADGFCESTCGTHGQARALVNGKHPKFPYIWVGNSETQCPGQCAWPFHQPIYGPQTPPLIAPNNDVGMDGMIMNLAGLLASTATNPSRNGFFQGPATAPLEAASACSGIYGAGAYPGYPGKLMVNPTTGASYNAHGAYGKEYLVPALYDPATSSCFTLV